MNAEPKAHPIQPAPRERVLFGLYQLATFVCFSVLDDAAMMALALS